MNLLDRLVASIAPVAGLRRALARDAVRSYAAASHGRLAQGWNGGRGSRDGMLESGRRTMTARAADLGRNNPWLHSALRRLPAEIVGTGPVPSVVDAEEAEAKAVLADFAVFCGEGGGRRATFASDLALLARTIVEEGECFVVWTAEPSSKKRRVPLSWRLLPPAFLDAARTTPDAGGNFVREGVEYDEAGEVAGYWFFDRHPADTLLVRMPEARFYPVERVDHVFEQVWIGQRRGVPWFAPVTMAADELAQYEQAAIWKARMAASLALVLSSPPGVTSPLSGAGKDAGGRQLEQLAPGAILRTAPGETVTTVDPPTDDNLRVFWQTRLYAISAGLGLPYASLTGDLSNANYSSLREGKILFWQLLDSWQWLMIHDQFLRHAWRRFCAARFAAKPAASRPLYAVKWSFPRRPWVDPLKDAKALELELSLGLTTWPDAVSARGEDADGQLAEIQLWRDRLAAAGINLARQMPGAVPAVSNPDADEPDSDAKGAAAAEGKTAK